MRKFLYPLALLMLGLSFCSGKKEILGTVDGKAMDLSDFKAKAAAEFGIPEKELNDDALRSLFREYYTALVFYQEGEAKGFLAQPDIKERGERRQKSVLKSLLNQKLWENEIQPKLAVEDSVYEPYREKRKVRHLLLTTDQKKKEEVLKKVLKIKAEIEGGLDFAKAAAQYSEDPGSQGQGGDLGWIDYASPLVANFQKGVMESVVGKVSDPVETEYGYHLILVEERKQSSIDEVKKDTKITEALQRQKAVGMADEFMAKLREKYKDKISFYPERIKDPVKNKDLDLYRVEGADFMTVGQAAALMGPELEEYKKNPSKMIPTVQRKLIDADLRYLEGLNQGYDQDKDLQLKVRFQLTLHFGHIYESHLRDEIHKEFAGAIKEEDLKAFYEQNKESYAEPVEGQKEEEGKAPEMKVLPYEKVKEWVKSDLISRKAQEKMGVLKKELFAKYKIQFQD